MSSKHNPSTELITFAECARAFCVWVEAAADEGDEILKARRLLAELQVAVIALPYVSPSDDDNAYEFTHDQWKSVYARFGSLPFQYYSEIFEPFDMEAAPVVGDLADDLADIYGDLNVGLLLFDQQRYADANWLWRHTFYIHWGEHLTSALRAIHAYIATTSDGF